MKILMVCLGNICRSPMAEGIMKHLLSNHGIKNVLVDSAGTGDWHVGDLPDRRAIACAKKRGIDISNQRARQIRTKDLDHFDLIFTMDTMNLKDVQKLALNEDQRSKINLLLEAKYPNEKWIVPDPYHTNLFDESFNLIYAGCEVICQEILTPKST